MWQEQSSEAFVWVSEGHCSVHKHNLTAVFRSRDVCVEENTGLVSCLNKRSEADVHEHHIHLAVSQLVAPISICA